MAHRRALSLSASSFTSLSSFSSPGAAAAGFLRAIAFKRGRGITTNPNTVGEKERCSVSFLFSRLSSSPSPKETRSFCRYFERRGISVVAGRAGAGFRKSRREYGMENGSALGNGLDCGSNNISMKTPAVTTNDGDASGGGKEKTVVVADHYNAHTASSYEDAFFYSEGEYMSHLRDLIRRQLDMEDGIDNVYNDDGGKCRRILDVGGGTGNFTSMLVDDRLGGEKAEAVVVDPFLPTSSCARDDSDVGAKLRFVKASAEDFIVPSDADSHLSEWWKRDYHHVLLKEVVHHFDAEDRVPIFAGFRRGASSVPARRRSSSRPSPSMLILTRPQLDIDYPLFPAARAVWAKNQPSSEVLMKDLRSAGFSDVECRMEPYPCEIRLETWLSMVKNRFWSTFSEFTDEELEEGCEYIARTREADEKGIIRFEDRILFISAWK